MDQVSRSKQKTNQPRLHLLFLSYFNLTAMFLIAVEVPIMIVTIDIVKHPSSNLFVILLGGLHIEMVALKMLGDWLEDSSWTSALVEAKIASAGVAN